MEKFIKINDKIKVNPSVIAYISTCFSHEYNINELKDMLPIDELERLGFPVRKRDEFIRCSWEEAKNAVKKNPTKCNISHSCISGYTKLESGKKDLVDAFYKYNKKTGQFESITTSIPRDIIVGYQLHLTVPCGGINYSHAAIRITPAEMEQLYKKIDIVE